MRVIKRVLCPERVRRVPKQFNWVDHRLVRDKYICGCGPEALALYLLLVTVGDAEGLSYYADATAASLLSMSIEAVVRARRKLVEAGLIAYRRPLYQVLSLCEPPHPPPAPMAPHRAPRSGELRSIAEVISSMGRRMP
jgi:hypothetical protein